jgi:RNA polymerase sigma-70 factor, ECF subfamily
LAYLAIHMTETKSADIFRIRHADLLEKVAAVKDRVAFGELFDYFAPRVKSFMMRKGAGSELAEDLVQETMITVWSKAQLYSRDKGSVSTWIFTIARNLRIDRLRREGSVQFTDIDDFDAPSDAAPVDTELR